jgi:hypothetical protein
MYSLDTNIQTALDRRADLVHAVQNYTSTNTDEPAGRTLRSAWSALLAALVAAIGLGWLIQ